MTSPTQRTLALLRKEGWKPWIVEKWNPYAGIRQDLYGFIDIVAIKPGESGVTGIQCTTASNLSARIKKAQDLPAYHMWVACGNKVEFHGWSKKGPRGKLKTWQVARQIVTKEGGTKYNDERGHESPPEPIVSSRPSSPRKDDGSMPF